jgi:electron transfer flavoprotein beta subunit
VPGTTKVDIDPETGALKRDGIASKMNPYDLYALETALRLKERCGGGISVITMGPPQAEAIIREAYMMGADRGYILTDRRFAGSDVLATSYTLSQGIKKTGDIDIIICGKQTTDGDTAQVGAAIAEWMGIPHVTWVRRIEEITDSGMVVEKNMAESFETVKVKFPCLITVDKDIYMPRLPSYRKMKETKDKEIIYLTLDDLEDKDAGRYGLNGSPTQVERIFQPEGNDEHIIWEDTKENCSEKLFEVLSENKYIRA